MDEIVEAVKKRSKLKALGIDGFNIKFVKKPWVDAH